MTLYHIAFILFAVTAVLSAGFILFTKNILYAAFGLLATLLSVAGLYVFAAAEFLAVTQVVIYVGGILVLILFGVFMTTRPHDSVFFKTEGIGVTKSIVLLTVLLTAVFWLIFRYCSAKYPWIEYAQPPAADNSNIRSIGTSLLTTNIVPFEIVAILLMAALMGAAFLASRAIRREGQE
jgi:NADH:ubiquinone oxidoreductase subunit 6 (subunit J)